MSDLDPTETAARQRVQTIRLIAWVRWVAVAAGLADGLLATPAPVLGRAGVLAAVAVMAAYNVPLWMLARLARRHVEKLALVGLAGDFAVCTAWMLLTANDVVSSTKLVYVLVAIEAALLYRRRGAVGFIAAFLPAYAAFYWVRWSAFGFGVEGGAAISRTAIVVMTAIFVGLLVEQSERRREALSEALRRQSELHHAASMQAQRHESLLHAISDVGEGLIITEHGRMIYGNRAYEAITGYSADELAAFPSLLELAPPDQRRELASRLALRLSGGDVPTQYESQLVTRDGRVVDIETAMRTLPAEGPNRIIAVVRDISDRKRAQLALEASERQAHLAARRDPLTGIANRRAWDEEIERATARARRDPGVFSVAILDLDGFKEYNDDWGHPMGDRLLQLFTTRWLEGLRDDDFLARYGGDEFAVLFHGATLREASAVLERLRAVMPSPQSFSAGVAEFDGIEPTDSLMARADAALYESKRSGPGRVAAVREGESIPRWSRLIPRILSERSLSAVYQPICRLDDRVTVGFEALARPAGFAADSSVDGLFAAAQRLGFSRDMDWLCRRAALENAKRLPAHMPLFINVSVHALLDPLHEVDQMLMLVRWAGRCPQDIVLEISERENVRDLARLDSVLTSYRDAGFRFAVDDVGEGHSTLEVLACAQPEFIKVARGLSVAASSPGARSAVLALVTFASSNGSQLVAEGLETEEDIRVIRGLGVGLGQGFALALPAAAGERGVVALSRRTSRL